MSLKRNPIVLFEIFRKFHKKTVREVQIPVPWGKISGKWWGSTHIKPILFLHGVQDNAGSFDRLINILSDNCSYLAIDLPGHGRSTHFPKGLSYEFLPFTFLINRIVEYFKWTRISLIGHSISAIVCYNFASVYPEKVHSLVCLDGLTFVSEPTPKKSIRYWFDKYSKFEETALNQMEPPSYTLLDELKQKKAKGYSSSVNAVYAHHIYMRNIAESKTQPGKYYLIRDPVLTSFINFANPQNEEDVVEDAKTFYTPTLLFKTDHNFKGEEKTLNKVLEIMRHNNKDFEFHKINGTHHVHLNEPEKIGPIVNKFLEKYHKLETSNLGKEHSIFSVSE